MKTHHIHFQIGLVAKSSEWEPKNSEMRVQILLRTTIGCSVLGQINMNVKYKNALLCDPLFDKK